MLRAFFIVNAPANHRGVLLNSSSCRPHFNACADHRVRPAGPLENYLRERRRELVTGAQAEDATPRDAAIVADACVDAARRIMTEPLALPAGAPQGRA